MKTSRRSAVDPFIVMDVMEAAREAEAAGRDIVHMEVGQPASGAPARALEAAARALQDGPLGYTVALGLPALREGIADLYRRRHGLSIDPRRVVVTAGSSGAFTLAFLTALEAGERMALGDPSYPSYRNILKALGVETLRIETGEADRWQPSVAALSDPELPDWQALLVASPANPTGSMLDRARLAALSASCRARGAWLISDEIYHGLTYEAPAVSALEVDDECIVINSFSKYWSMTGWRIGWMIVPEHILRTVERLAQNLFICPPHIAQVAALAALGAEDECEANRMRFSRNRELLMNALPEAGFDRLAPPDGAFYLYADVTHITDDSRVFCARMMAEAGVAATPGIDFDPIRGGKTVRFSFARSEQEMLEGARRLRTWMRG